MGRLTPLWASAFAGGIALAALGFVVDDLALLGGGVVLGVAGAAGQAFAPGEPTAREREAEAEATDDAPRHGEQDASWPGEEHGDVEASPGPEPVEDPPPVESGAGDGVTEGICGECGAKLTLSDRRPVRASCPNCGNTSLVEE